MDQAGRLRRMAAVGAPRPQTRQPIARGGRTRCRSIAVTSGKGGVGKSNIAICLAVAASRLNKRVLVFDGDLGLANLHILLGMAPKYNLAHVVKEECSLEETLCHGPDGITIIPGASGVLSMGNLPCARLESLIRQLSLLEEEYDLLVIDGGAGIGHAAVQLSLMADTALLILTPDPTSLADAYATLKILLTRGMKSVGVVVNMARSDAEARETFRRLDSLSRNFLNSGVELVGSLPSDRKVVSLVRQQRNPVVEMPTSDFSRGIRAIARRLCNMPSSHRSGFFARFLGRGRKTE